MLRKNQKVKFSYIKKLIKYRKLLISERIISKTIGPVEKASL